jgi:hypothetical protein
MIESMTIEKVLESRADGAFCLLIGRQAVPAAGQQLKQKENTKT